MNKIMKIFYFFGFASFTYLISQNYVLLYDLDRDASAPDNIRYMMKNPDDIRVKKAIERLNRAILAIENKQDVKDAHNEITNLYKKYFNFNSGYAHMPIMNPEYNPTLKPFENALKKIRDLEAKLSNMHSEKYLESKYTNLKKAKQEFSEALAEAREKYKNDSGFLKESKSLRKARHTHYGYAVMPLTPDMIIDAENRWLINRYPKALKANEQYHKLRYEIEWEAPEFMDMEKQIKSAEAEYEKQVGLEEARKKLRTAVGKEFLDAQNEFEKIIEKVASELEKAEKEKLSTAEEINEKPEITSLSSLGSGFR